MITGGVNKVGEVGKWRQRGERDAVEDQWMGGEA